MNARKIFKISSSIVMSLLNQECGFFGFSLVGLCWTRFGIVSHGLTWLGLALCTVHTYAMRIAILKRMAILKRITLPFTWTYAIETHLQCASTYTHSTQSTPDEQHAAASAAATKIIIKKTNEIEIEVSATLKSYHVVLIKEPNIQVKHGKGNKKNCFQFRGIGMGIVVGHSKTGIVTVCG